MKKARKGFTLTDVLVAVTVLGSVIIAVVPNL